MAEYFKSFTIAEISPDDHQLDIDTTIDLTTDISPVSGDFGSVSVSGDGGFASAGISVSASGSGFASASGSVTAAVGDTGSSFASAEASGSGDVVLGGGFATAGTLSDSFTLSDLPTVPVPLDTGAFADLDDGDIEELSLFAF